MNKDKAIEELRNMATRLVESSEDHVLRNTYGNNIKDLLQELNIYHIELEHQNNELERSERELAASREEYVELFENAPIGYVIIDKNIKIYKLNSTFISRFAPSSKPDMSFEGQSFDIFVCPEFQSAFYLYCKMLVNARTTFPLELKLFNRFGVPQYVLITASLHDESGELFRLVVSDISMQKKLEAQLLMAKEKAEESDRQKSHFLTNFSHDIRTPLTTIIGFIDLLNESNLNPALLKEYLDSIMLSANMLQGLIDEVLDLSTLESGIVPLRCDDVDVGSICSELVSLIQRSIQKKNVLIRNEVEEVPLLWTDPIRLRQIIFSILEHAAGNATSGTVVVHTSYIPMDDFKGTLVVEFHGENIFSAENSLEINFHRKPVSQNCAGLGLFLARQVVKFMEGTVNWIHPLDTLRIEIPLEKSRRNLPNSTQKKKKAPEQFPRRKCLLVDDVVMNLKVLGAIIKLMNCEPTLASSAKEALELLDKNQYDFIMTDLWMPDMSGEELAMEIRQNPKYNTLPIYAVTADVERESTFDMTFFASTIIKPVNIDKIRKLFAAMPVK